MELNNGIDNSENSLKEILFLPPDFFGKSEDDNANKLKTTLCSTGIVELRGKPEYFVDIDDELFYKFIPGYGIPTNFVSVENEDFNGRTKNLLAKLNESDKNEQELCQLIDYLFYDKYWLTLDADTERNSFKSALDKHKLNIPVKNRAGEYISLAKNTILLFDPDNNKNDEKYKKYFVENKSDKNYAEYITALGVKQPSAFIKEEYWFKKTPLDFVEYLYRQYARENQINTNGLVSYLIDKLDDEFKRDSTLRFIFDCALLTKMNEIEISLKPDELVKYAEKINALNNNCITLKDNELDNTVCNEIITEIFEELKFVDEKKLNEIKTAISMNNLVLCKKTEKGKDIGYTKLKGGKIYLWPQLNFRKYRDCIGEYIQDAYSIKIDKRSYSISAINTDYSEEVDNIGQDEFNELLEGEIIQSWENTEKEDKKRLLMEPYYFNKKFYPGYAKTCPLCNKLIVTEITSMRIKSIYTENDGNKHKYDFICCNTCADLFYFCENQPVIKGLEKIGEIDSELELNFYLEPYYIYTPYSVKFKPRPVHRYILNKQKGNRRDG